MKIKSSATDGKWARQIAPHTRTWHSGMRGNGGYLLGELEVKFRQARPSLASRTHGRRVVLTPPLYHAHHFPYTFLFGQCEWYDDVVKLARADIA